MSASIQTRFEPAIRTIDFRPHGGVREAWLAREGEVLLSGPAGTGKTRGLLELLHLRALKYAGSRGLLCRQTRVSLTQTALVTFDKEVNPAADGAKWHASKQEYQYKNGSVIVVAGLDNEAQRVFSGQYDHIHVNEATELDESTWENLTTRLRNGKSARQQIMGDCNPDRPTHWLKVRCDRGVCRLIESRHEDNPRLFDGTAWTAEGLAYLARLEALSGPRRLRLRYGRWVRAEGVIYENWDSTVHIIDSFEVPAWWPRVWAFDFGFTAPFCWLDCALDGDGRLYVVQQIYHTRRLAVDHARHIAALVASTPPPAGAIADPEDAAARAVIEAELGVATIAAQKAGRRRPGIQAVLDRLRVQPDGRPRLYVFRDSLVERDPALIEAKRPCCLQEEFDGYVWRDKTVRDEPADGDDHALDALRYLVSALDAPGPEMSGQPTVYRS